MEIDFYGAPEEAIIDEQFENPNSIIKMISTNKKEILEGNFKYLYYEKDLIISTNTYENGVSYSVSRVVDSDNRYNTYTNCHIIDNNERISIIIDSLDDRIKQNQNIGLNTSNSSPIIINKEVLDNKIALLGKKDLNNNITAVQASLNKIDSLYKTLENNTKSM